MLFVLRPNVQIQTLRPIILARSFFYKLYLHPL